MARLAPIAKSRFVQSVAAVACAFAPMLVGNRLSERKNGRVDTKDRRRYDQFKIRPPDQGPATAILGIEDRGFAARWRSLAANCLTASSGGPPCHPMVSGPKSRGLEEFLGMPLPARASRRDKSCAGQADATGSANNFRLGQSACWARQLIVS